MNSRHFEDKSNQIQEIKMNCLSLLYFWCKQKLMEDIEDLVDFIGEVYCFFFLGFSAFAHPDVLLDYNPLPQILWMMGFCD